MSPEHPPTAPWRRWSLRLLLPAAVVGLAIGGAWWWLSQPNRSLIVEQTLTAVTSRLKQTYPQALVSTAEGQYSFVFPYDFADLDHQVSQILGRRLQQLATARVVPQTEAELALLGLYDYAKTLGLPLKGSRKFVVLQVRVKLGFDFKQTNLQGRWEAVANGAPTLAIRLPELTMTDFVIVDGAAGKAGFPECDLSPAQWKKLMEYLKPSIVTMVEDRGLREEARKNARQVFDGLFRAAGLQNYRIEGL